MGRTVRVKSFELVAKDINDVDVKLLHALSIGVGWPHRPKDWDFLRRAGHGIVAVDGIGRVFGSAMWFPYGHEFATIGLVITSPRTQAQGTGRWLMEQVFERCGDRNLTLNSTHAAYHLYLSLGFTKEATVYQWQGEAVSPPPPVPALTAELSSLSTANIGEIAALDERAFGANRQKLLALLSEGAAISVLRRGGEAVGFSMKREFGRGHVIGPIVASNDCDAIHLTAVHLRDLAGQFVRVDTREQTGPFADFLQQSRLGINDTVSTMSKGKRFLNRKENEPWVYGLAGHALS
ncbi:MULTISPECIES: GNAT family N-acetyltransferase [Bradyrhizobium]|uniref:GNAT family N-acetyltransferase n=1 Tax=Bradyrhizobium vignae TaxID=1549949 RepID=A0A2U3PW90_9BRAD|nr:GNAT family N-acetyltransferase [Bradyrhizobium vignae]MBP0113462.1 GNAT family N-acetyltransferase [Bradyrhizobium vignae]RXG97409.1 N-acetyltransferase [Bradyrhizobium vignae]SPP93431.1 putative acyltransferase [Bradyrhizobium vignae]